ncbi:MAG: hypothetical protein MZV63_20115 [Marinilabiliales bacterium]|nr:hypothetical protein [Marinilabiliales bacterium]
MQQSGFPSVEVHISNIAVKGRIQAYKHHREILPWNNNGTGASTDTGWQWKAIMKISDK